MKLFTVTLEGVLYVEGYAVAASAGDQVKIFLNQDANPGLPEFVLGVIQNPIRECGCETTYIIEYDEADLLGEATEITLGNYDHIETASCCEVVDLALQAEVAARIAADLLKADKAITITGGGLATGGGDLSANRVIAVTEASQAEAEAGASGTVVLTPRRVTQWWTWIKTQAATIAGLWNFTTSPTVPTPDADDDSTKAANTEWVNAQPSWELATFGDSILSDMANGYWPDQLLKELSLSDAQMYEFAVPSQAYNTTLANLSGYLAGVPVATRQRRLVAFVGTGTNDLGIGRSAADTWADLEDIVAALHAHGAKVCVLLPINSGLANYTAFVALVQAAYDAGEFEWLLNLATLGLHTFDGVHPDESGNAFIAADALQALQGVPNDRRYGGRFTLTQATSLAITNISAAAAAVVTSAGHGLTTGDVVNLTGTDSTPVIDGIREVTVLDANTFSVPITTTVSGSAGAINTGVVQIASGVPYLSQEIRLIKTYQPNGGNVEVFHGVNMFAYNNKYRFLLHSVAYLAADSFGIASPIMSGQAIPDGAGFVDLYLVNNDNIFTEIFLSVSILSR